MDDFRKIKNSYPSFIDPTSKHVFTTEKPKTRHSTTTTTTTAMSQITTPREQAQYFEEEESAFRTKIPYHEQNVFNNFENTYKDPFSTRFEQLQNILEEKKLREKEEELRKTIQNYMQNSETSPYSMILDKYRNNGYGMDNSRYDDGESFTFDI